MPTHDTGWDWFEDTGPTSQNQNADILDMDLAKSYARCFRTEDGQKVLKHLQSITLDRAMGPTTSDNLLRHVEGQRQLVATIAAYAERGRSA